MKKAPPFLEPQVIFCDNHILVGFKPAGMLTQPTKENPLSLEGFLKDWVKEKFEKKGEVFLHAVHRLDRPVSGLVLFAKTSKALSRLNTQAKNQEIQRVYIAEVEGILPEKLGRLDHYLIHGNHQAILGKKEDESAKHARLFYEVLKETPHTTFVQIELETGRYHQIRAQFSAIGHPVVGDEKYKAAPTKGKTIHLHSAKLLFEHPITLERLKFETPAPFSK